MKKIFLSMLLVFGVLVLSTTASYAAIADCAIGPPAAGTVRDMQENHADAKRVEQRAYSQQIVKRNDSGLAVSCFDLGMRLTSALGLIFSDRVPPVGFTFPSLAFMMPRIGFSLTCSAGVFTPSLTFQAPSIDLTRGAGSLMGAFQSVIEGALSTILNNFAGALTAFFGGLLAQLFTAADLGALAGLLGFLPNFSLPGFSVTIPCLGVFQTPAFQLQLAGLIQSLINSLFPGCNMVALLWSTGGAGSVEGAGMEGGTPYSNLMSILSGAPAAAGASFMQELSNLPGILNNALNNLTALSTPGALPTFPASPTFTINTSSTAITAAM